MTRSALARRHTQERGRARRDALLASARDLLGTRRLDELTLPMVAQRAGIPASSTYHFFGDISELYLALARAIALEMADITPSAAAAGNWQDAVVRFMAASAQFFNADPAALQLMLGPGTSPSIKRAACYEDLRFGTELHRMLEDAFVLPPLDHAVDICFRAVQLADALFTLSVVETGGITDEMLEEAVRAATGYLSYYLPPLLGRRKISKVP